VLVVQDLKAVAVEAGIWAVAVRTRGATEFRIIARPRVISVVDQTITQGIVRRRL
jgi:hypothetical protein